MTLADRLGAGLAARLKLPLICAPMFQISCPELVIAACRAGIIGAFPTSNCSSLDQLDEWLCRIREDAISVKGGHAAAPACANLIIRQARLEGDLSRLIRHRVEMVITSVGSPAPVVGPLHEIECKVFADVASVAHAEKAIAAGVDGLIMLTAGAGGQTGWANPLAFIGAVRSFFDGPLVLAGGVGNGRALWAAKVMGYDLAYMGTRFIAAKESNAPDAYRRMLVASSLDDVITSKAFTGLDSNMLRPSIVAAGLDPDRLEEAVTRQETTEIFGAAAAGPKRWKDIWSAGHSVSAVRDVLPVTDIVRQTTAEYTTARDETALIT